jgi:hypothetical protein
MTGKVVDLIKSILGLSGLAYAVGFVVVNTEFLRWGVSESDWIDSRYIAAGAIYLFVALPTMLFPYLRGLEQLNEVYKAAKGHYFSESLDSLYRENEFLISKWVGPFIVVGALLAALIVFYAPNHGGEADLWGFLWKFCAWYLISRLLAARAAVLFNLGFYWRAKAADAVLHGGSPFWNSFLGNFVRSYKASFSKSFHLTAGRDPTSDEVQSNLSKTLLGGTASEGFLQSAVYKGVALFLASVISFGAVVYPSLPASIGGGSPQSISLLLGGSSASGLSTLGLPGRRIDAAGSDSSGASAQAFEYLTDPLPLLGKTSEGYFVLVYTATESSAIKIPTSMVESVSYKQVPK